MKRISPLAAQVTLARIYDLNVDEIHRALTWARIAKAAAQKLVTVPKPSPVRRAQWDFGHVPEPKDGKAYCGQCDRRVAPDEAGRCLDSFCKATALRFLGEAIAAHEADKARLDSPPASDSLGVSR
jgi:hypothetical protein